MSRPRDLLARRGRHWRRWPALAAVVALAVAYVRLADTACPVTAYRVIDDRIIMVQTVTGPATWTRVTSMADTAEAVTVTVGEIRVPLPLAGYGDDLVWLTVTLHDPLGSRSVVDGTSGQPVPHR